MKKVILSFFILLYFASLGFSQTLYSVTFPNDTTIVGCGAVADTIYPQIVKYGNCNFAVGVSVTDQVFSLNTGGQCSKISRRYRIVWWCGYDPNGTPLTTIPNPGNTNLGPTVLGTEQNFGHLEYTQIIKVLDDDKPMFLDCPSDMTICDYSTNDPLQYNNGHIDNCEAPVQLSTQIVDACTGASINLRYLMFLDLDNNGSMETTLSSSDANAWPIIKQVSGDTLDASIDFSPDYELPYGTHAIQWIARDNCGNQSYCKYNFHIEDCLNPTVVCKNGVSVNIMQTGMITLPLSAILEYTYDNCTPVSQLKTAVQHLGAGSTFPVGQVEVAFDCNQLGAQFVEVWSQDAAGNDDYCIATVTIQDNMGNCGNTSTRPGQVVDAKGQGLANIPMSLRRLGSNTPDWTTQTNAQGYFDFGQVPACGLALSVSVPDRSAAVNSLDALALSRHLLDLEAITNPYRLLAADVDHDFVLTEGDIDALIQKILQKNPSANDWMVLPKGMLLPADPFAVPMPDMLDLAACAGALPDSLMLQIAPMADVDGSWTQSKTKGGLSTEIVPLRYNDQEFEKGALVSVGFYLPSVDGIPAFEFALNYDRSILNLQQKNEGLVPEKWMFGKNYAGLFACAWQDGSLVNTSAKGDEILAFSLTFKAEKAGRLSDILSLDIDYMAATAYKANRQKMDIQLEATQILQRPKQKIAISAYPNPSKGQTNCTVEVPHGETVQVWVSDLYGNTNLLSQKALSKGTHTFELQHLRSGVYVVRALSATGTAVLQLVVE